MAHILLIITVLLVVGGGIYFYINHKLGTQEKERAAYHYPDGYDALFAEVAYQSKDSSFCRKISPYAESGGGFNPVGLQIILTQSECYASLGECDLVRPASTEFMDGSKYTPEYCRANYRISQPAALMTEEQAKAILPELGYSTNVPNGFGNSFFDYSYNLTSTPEFQAKVRAMPDRP